MQESYIVYNGILLGILIFAALDTITSSETYRAAYRRICFLIILIAGVIRYDVGPDYLSYVTHYYSILNYGSGNSSLDYLLFDSLTKLFGSVPFGYVLVLGVYQFLTLLVVFKILNERHVFYSGLFFFIVLDFWFRSFDGVRQELACVFFLYSIKYIERRNLKKYLCCIIIAFFAHTSAVFLIPVYWIARVQYSKLLLSVLLVVFITGHYLHVWEVFFSFIYSSVPYYNTYAGSDYVNATGQFNLGLGFLWIGTLVFFVLWLCKKLVLLNLIAIGGILYFFAGGNLNIARVANYFLQVEIVALPLIFKEIKGIAPLKYLVIVLSLIYYQSLIGKNNFSYKTVFSEEFLLQQFEERAN